MRPAPVFDLFLVQILGRQTALPLLGHRIDFSAHISFKNWQFFIRHTWAVFSESSTPGLAEQNLRLIIFQTSFF